MPFLGEVDNMIYVAQSYGDDLNDGRNIDRPVQTIATALTIASSIGVDCTVSILDDQIYTEGWAPPSGFKVNLWAPNAHFDIIDTSVEIRNNCYVNIDIISGGEFSIVPLVTPVDHTGYGYFMLISLVDLSAYITIKITLFFSLSHLR
jgi:hypothetical protein